MAVAQMGEQSRGVTRQIGQSALCFQTRRFGRLYRPREGSGLRRGGANLCPNSRFDLYLRMELSAGIVTASDASDERLPR